MVSQLSMEDTIEKNCWVVARRATLVFVAVIFLVYLTI
ncbi:putative membrane protein [Bartonella bacilliformis KC583]|uniref:Putative membrane protein n=1 Tax=Bartonella bacilliformis (strain ATCC 35685 / KC583 / Herrer 020/F12,63) TaxID=360095 RepID=A1USD1_BARBK|nr:putative membrane protein [Bartonella bacilliformis KC583]